MGFPQAVSCHHHSYGEFHQFFWISYNSYPSTSLPPSRLYKSLLLELVRFRTAWEPSTSSFTPLFIVSASTGISCHFQGSQLPSYAPTGVFLHRRRGCILQCGSLGYLLQLRPDQSLPCLSNSCLLLKHVSPACCPSKRTVPSVDVPTRASVLLSHIVVFSSQDVILLAY